MGSDTATYPLCAAGNSNGCPVATGIEQMEHAISVSVYPNPSGNRFFVETNSSDELILNLFDISGKLVFNENAQDKSIIDLTALNEGVYTLTIKTSGQSINRKLVIVH